MMDDGEDDYLNSSFASFSKKKNLIFLPNARD